MCRMFAMVSKKPTNADFYFYNADTPFVSFSKRNNHGWGRAYFREDGKVDIFKQGQNDVPSEKYDFGRMRGISSRYIIVHFRRTRKPKSNHTYENAQPFEFKFENDDWIFAHNGSVEMDLLS
jgi:predicted glutamine amidotransferase